jgi:NAD-dependent deacetylase
MEQGLERVITLLSRARSVLFITGAGISAESGLPTYRGIGGLYNVENAEGDMPIEEVLSAPTFRRRPELTWKTVDVRLDVGAVAACEALWAARDRWRHT